MKLSACDHHWKLLTFASSVNEDRFVAVCNGCKERWNGLEAVDYVLTSLHSRIDELIQAIMVAENVQERLDAHAEKLEKLATCVASLDARSRAIEQITDSHQRTLEKWSSRPVPIDGEYGPSPLSKSLDDQFLSRVLRTLRLFTSNLCPPGRSAPVDRMPTVLTAAPPSVRRTRPIPPPPKEDGS